MADQVRHPLAIVSHHDRSHCCVERDLITTGERRGLRSVGRTSEKPQQRGVQHDRAVRSCEVESVRSPQRKHARPQRVFKRLTSARVGCQRQRGRQLHHPNLVVAHRRHCPTFGGGQPFFVGFGGIC